jgi:hypothetical protein
MASAFEDMCRELGLAERDDAMRDLVAKTIIDCATKGVLDSAKLRDCTREALRS